MRQSSLSMVTAVVLMFALAATALSADDPLLPVNKRFAGGDVQENPSFQRHVLPLMGRLGCNGRACHGSFQGQGGFQLSLFGYDFKTDHEALLNGGDEPRVDPEKPLDSLILNKPTDEDEHEGGQRFAKEGWEYNVFRRWIEAGAENDAEQVTLTRLEVSPAEIVFQKEKQTIQLQVVVHWSDGSSEDVTPICRFQSNDEAIAAINGDGLVSSTGKGDTHVVVFYDNGITPVPTMLPIDAQTAAKYPKIPTPTKVDELVVEKLKKLGVVPADVCSDAEFLRRVSLDLTGTLPAAAEVEQFLANESPNKRTEKIDELLARPTYSAWWATKFSDWTGNNSQNSGNNAFRNEESEQWYVWIRDRIERNVAYDEIMEGIILAKGRDDGQSFEDYCRDMGKYFRSDDPVSFAEHHSLPHYWSRRNIRRPEEKALSFSYAFMGVRIQCAQCHKHPFDQWSKQDFEQFTAFFDGITYGNRREDRETMDKMNEKLGLAGKRGNDLRRMYPELLNDGKLIPFQEVYFNGRTNNANRNKKNRKNRSGANRVITPKLLGGEEVVAKQYGDPREALMEWLRAEDNPYFAKAFVNRVWANYFNRGIIEPADDLNLANPPSNEALLDWLASEFVARGFDMKWLHKTIVSSHTYQRGWQPNETNRLDERNFSRAIPRRLPAEVLYDAVQMATAGDETAASWHTDVSDRAIGEKSGYSNRGRTSYALTAFGKPMRVENCDCERSLEPSLLQTLYLRNDNETLTFIERRGSWLDQIAREHKLRFTPASNNAGQARQVAQLQQQIKRLNRQIEKLKAQDKRDGLEQLVEQRVRLQRRIARLRGAESSKPTDDSSGEQTADSADEKPMVAEHGPKLVRQAYLRTVNRPPNDRELQRSLAYLHESENLALGLRDLMWALINTKEFIVNH